MPGTLNDVEGVGDIAFGDFNGNGKTDVYLSAYTDMEHPVNSYQLINDGNNFTKINLGSNVWQHAAFSGDINTDGYDDIVVANYGSKSVIYLGSETGLSEVTLQDWNTKSSGVAIADFMNDGTPTLIQTDSLTGSSADTKLVNVLYNND